MEGRELRRSYTQFDLPSRRQDKQSLRGKRQPGMTPALRGKFPTLEIYRPPGQRLEGEGSRLNVYAKEFVMQGSLQTSKSTGNMLSSSARNNNNQQPAGFPLQLSKTALLSGPVKNNPQLRVQWDSGLQQHSQQHQDDRNNNKIGNKVHKTPVGHTTELKRSKSMSSAHGESGSVMRGRGSTVIRGGLTKRFSPPSAAVSATGASHIAVTALPEPSDLEMEALIQETHKDPKEKTTAELLDLCKRIVEVATSHRAHAEALASCAIRVIERERHCTFLDSLLNCCQYALEERARGDSNSPGKYYACMAFFCSLYSQLKRVPLEDKPEYTGTAPSSVVLYLLVQACIGTLRSPVLKLRQEIECLFFVVTTIGRELETEHPGQLEVLMVSVRDAFLKADSTEAIRKTLLQLVEMYASHWHLSSIAVIYYQSSLPQLP